MISARLVETGTGLRLLEKDWARLASARSDPFLSYSWMAAWFDHYGSDAQMRVVVLERGAEVVGIVPLVLSRETRRRLPVRVLRSAMRRSSGPARTGIVCAPGDEVVVIEAFVAFLAATRREWDMLEMEGLRADGTQLALLTAAAARWHVVALPCEPIETARILPVTMPWPEYLRSRGRHFRRHIADERRRLDRAGTWCVELARTPERIALAMSDVETIVLEHFGFSGPEQLAEEDRRVLAFTKDVVARFAARDAIDLRVLRVNGRPAACLLSLLDGITAYPLLTKYVPDVAAASPGRAVVLSLVQEALESGYREIDFLSNWNYLARLTDQTHVYVKLTAFHAGWYSRAMRFEREFLTPQIRKLRRKAPAVGEKRG